MKSDKELFSQLRALPCETLWNDEVAQFNRATPKERMSKVAVIRAVGFVFSAQASAQQRAEARAWMVQLLRDPQEKIRRYAAAALPKLGGGPGAENEMLALLKSTKVDREKKAVASALDKIGGEVTLKSAEKLHPQTVQKIKARVARTGSPSVVRLVNTIASFEKLRIHLRCRRGLEDIVRQEVEEMLVRTKRFSILDQHAGSLAITPLAPFSLADLLKLRCFGTINFALGLVKNAKDSEALAKAITSPAARMILKTCTEGSMRYRLNFAGTGHQRGAVRDIVNRAFAMHPEILNDPSRAPWSMELIPVGQSISVELRPRLFPDPRFTYREADVAAASHPPLAACMARLAGVIENDVVWDPFCGSGLELIERALRGGVKQLYGTDVSAEAIAVANANVKAAGFSAQFVCGDFRTDTKASLPGGTTLIITNPPMGRRIRIQDMRGLITDLFDVAATALKPGGRLVFPNPLQLAPRDATLKLEHQKSIDLGGFDCRLEMYRKL